MPQEILGGNSPRRAERHKSKARGSRGVPARSKEDWLEEDYSDIRDAAVAQGVFEVGMSKVELAEALAAQGA